MILDKYPLVMAVALCALPILPGLGTQCATAQGAGAFSSLIPFAAEQAETPEGVAVDKVGNVCVSIRQSPFGPRPDLSDQLWKFSPSGSKTILADLNKIYK